MTASPRDVRPTRVVVLVKRFPRLSETFILGEFLELRRQGLPVELFAIMDPGESRAHPEAQALIPEVTYLQEGSIVHSLPAALRTARRHPWGVLRAAGWALTRHTRAAARNLIHAMVLLDRLAPDGSAHLHAHFLHSPAAIAYIARKINGQPYSLSGHAKDIYTTLPENLLMRCHDATFVTTCTEANRRFLIEQIGLSPARVWLCRHGVHLDQFNVEGARPEPGRILSIGRLVPKKGFDVLVRACGELRRRGVQSHLRIIGAGPLREELHALAEKEGIGDRVELPGSMSQAEIAQELARAELFALSPVLMADGDRDGIPNVLMEAMAARVPVVAAAVSGIPEVLTDAANARLVAPARVDELAAVLEELLGDPEQRAALAQAGYRFVADECAWPRAVAPLRSLLGESLRQAHLEPIQPAPVSAGGGAR